MRIAPPKCVFVIAVLLCGLVVSVAADHHEAPPFPTNEAAVASLPAALQPAYTAGLNAEAAAEAIHQSGDQAAIIAAELAMEQAIKNALVQTKNYVATASAEDKDKIAKVLEYFAHQDGPPPPDGMPPGAPAGPGQPPPPGPPAGPPDLMQMIDMMIQEVDQHIAMLQS
ncbi:MAG: hypothetical protein O7G87_21125, partial [bacterium]|nr:hypothetical protein [bacterium]